MKESNHHRIIKDLKKMPRKFYILISNIINPRYSGFSECISSILRNSFMLIFRKR